MRPPLISVIIPTFNRARFVQHAIDSVLSQGADSLEVIVIDDGSTDHTGDALSRYGKAITYHYQTNSGVSSARNAGLRLAQGAWAAFLDSDDEWLPNFVPRHMEAMRRYPTVVASVMNVLTSREAGGHQSIFEGRGLLPLFHGEAFISDERPLLTVLEYNLSPILQGALFRRDTLTKTRCFDTTLNIAEDLDLVGQMALRGSFAFGAEPVAKLIRRQEATRNLTSRWFESGIYSRQCLATVYGRFLSSPGLTPSERSRLGHMHSQNLRALGNNYLRASRKADARRCYRQAIAVHPSPQSVARLVLSYLPLRWSLRTIRQGLQIEPGGEA
jgi:glycosyltransferase involved in cell wall biosynthesis